MLTVRELLSDLDVRLVAGEAALDLPVRWVHITELTDPTPWLSGGELLLTTGLQLDTPERQREFVTRLTDHQLAGLGFGTGFGARDGARGFDRGGRRAELPGVRGPLRAAVHRDHRGGVHAAGQRAVRGSAPGARGAGAARADRPVRARAGDVGRGAGDADRRGGARVRLAVASRSCSARSGGRSTQATVATLETEIRERVRRREAARVHARRATRATGPGIAGGRRRGAAGGAAGPRVPEAWLVAIKDSGPLSDFDRLTLHQAVTIVALELLRARVAGDTERRLAGDSCSARSCAASSAAPSSPAGWRRSVWLTALRRW